MTHAVRRHPHGYIDIDFHRARAVALRRQALRDSATLRMASVSALVTVGALGFAAVIASTASTVRDQATAAWSVSSHMR